MRKKEIRKHFKEKRQALTIKEMLRLDDLLLIQFQLWPLDDIQTLLSYWPIKEKVEINTVLMADYLAFRIPGLTVAYPVMDVNEHILKPVSVTEDTQYQINQYGIAEPLSGDFMDPEEIDAVFVPLLAFDRKGYRVGYGKGFYDRFLCQCREDVYKIGFSYFDPVDVIEDINEFDVPLNVCITPNKLYEF
jgi:5-formyltetrahydrofolate cyclo-ligase